VDPRWTSLVCGLLALLGSASATATSRHGCLSNAEIRASRYSQSGTLSADLDGDGTAERAVLAADYDAPPRCRFALVVFKGERIIRTSLGQGLYRPSLLLTQESSSGRSS
jgi:hypothetical protein